MGTTQIFAAMSLAYDSFYKDRTYKVVQLAPCTITDPAMYKGFNMASVAAIKALDIFEIAGPNWYKTVVKLRKTLGIEALQQILLGGWGSTLKEISLKSFLHYAQNAKENRFQRYSDNYWIPLGKKKTDLYDLSLIDSTPFGFFFGDKDTECPNTVTQQTKDQMGDMVQAYHIYPGLDHGSMIAYNTDEYVQHILDFLKPTANDAPLSLMLQ